MHHRATFVAIM